MSFRCKNKVAADYVFRLPTVEFKITVFLVIRVDIVMVIVWSSISSRMTRSAEENKEIGLQRVAVVKSDKLSKDNLSEGASDDRKNIKIHGENAKGVEAEK